MVINDLTYSTESYSQYDLYLPEDKSKHLLLLFLHGGNFTSGDKADEDVWCRYYASQGYVAASINYPLYEKSNNKTTNVNSMIFCIRQAVSVIKLLCDNKDYELSAMALSGESAGGCLAMIYAYRDAANSPLPVRFVFQQAGAASLEPDDWGYHSTSEKINFVQMLTGQTVTSDMIANGQYHDMIAKISPASLVDSTTVPTLCAYGSTDKYVPKEMKEKLLQSFKHYGVKYDYIEYSHSGMGLLGDTDQQELYISKSLEYCQKYDR